MYKFSNDEFMNFKRICEILVNYDQMINRYVFDLSINGKRIGFVKFLICIESYSTHKVTLSNITKLAKTMFHLLG